MADGIDDYLADKPYEWIVQQVYARIGDLKAGSTADHRMVAEFTERLVQEHRAPDGVKGEPCVECGEAWPCGMIRSTFAPD